MGDISRVRPEAVRLNTPCGVPDPGAGLDSGDKVAIGIFPHFLEKVECSHMLKLADQGITNFLLMLQFITAIRDLSHLLSWWNLGLTTGVKLPRLRRSVSRL
jgi:hypothetical protein